MSNRCQCGHDRSKHCGVTVTIIVKGLTKSDYAKAISSDGLEIVIDWEDGGTDTIRCSAIDSLLVTAS